MNGANLVPNACDSWPRDPHFLRQIPVQESIRFHRKVTEKKTDWKQDVVICGNQVSGSILSFFMNVSNLRKSSKKYVFSILFPCLLLTSIFVLVTIWYMCIIQNFLSFCIIIQHLWQFDGEHVFVFLLEYPSFGHVYEQHMLCTL